MSNTLTKQRDYSVISRIELEFFVGLSKSAGQFRGRESPGDERYSIEAALRDAAGFISSSAGTTLDVKVCFDVSDCRDRNKKHVDRMYLGTLLVPDRDPSERQVTHFIALTKGDSCEIKQHIDLDFHVDSDEPKPSPHLQIGGRALTVKDREFSKRWNKHLDKPRFPTLPCCTPLLWHTAFLEFQECASVSPFLKQGWWKKLVRDAERSLWLPFLDDMRAITAKGNAIESFYPPPG